MIGPRRAGYSQFGGLTGDVESGARKRQGMAEARRMAEVSRLTIYLSVYFFGRFLCLVPISVAVGSREAGGRGLPRRYKIGLHF